MNDHREYLIERMMKWIQFAEEDLRLAEHAMLLSSGCPYRLIAYHAQQCAEKYVKAYLVFHETDFPYTHNLRKLIRLCGNEFHSIVDHADTLTPFAVTTRYPGLDEDVSKSEAESAIDTARMVKHVVRKSLLNQGVVM